MCLFKEHWFVFTWSGSLLGAGPVLTHPLMLKRYPGVCNETLTGMAKHQQCEREQSVFPLAAMGKKPKVNTSSSNIKQVSSKVNVDLIQCEILLVPQNS